MAEHEPGNGVGGSASPEGTTGGRRPAVPDHELLKCIGRGSYGEVWLARSVLGMLRAVKVVYRDRFRDARPYEREFTGILRVEPLSRASDGLVDILHVGRHEPEGYFYYVMELADDASEDLPVRNRGPSSAASYQPLTLARELKRRGRLPCEQCVQLGLNLSGALSHLHQNGLIHRDVKPSNILYVGGLPKLGDIGLVGETGESVSYVGTEGYIPPEGPGSPQADVFSLGKVLYEASTGQDRLEFPMLPTAVVDEPARAQLAELNEVYLRACAPDPRDRYQNAEELHADLALLHRGQSVRRQRRAERRWRRASIAGYAVAALVGLAIGTLWSPLRTGQASSPASKKTISAGNPAPVDLSGFYNASFTTNWMHDFEGNDMACLTPGLHMFGGVPFDARGLIQLRGKYGDGRRQFPAKVQGIPVKRKCQRLHFLHSTHWAVEHGQCIGSYLVHYSDGSEWEILLNYGEEISGWWRNLQRARPEERVVIVWTGTNVPASHSRSHDILALYKTTWDNPHPDRTVESIDCISALTPCSPFVVAITAE